MKTLVKKCEQMINELDYLMLNVGSGKEYDYLLNAQSELISFIRFVLKDSD